MARFRAAGLALFIASVLSVASAALGYRLGRPEVPSPFDQLVRTARELEARAARPISEEELVRAAIQGMLQALGDPYAAVLDEEDRRSLETLLSGTLVGIGVYLQGTGDGLRVASTLEGTPADRAGLRAGDLIVAVDGHDVRGLSVEWAGAFFTGPVGSVVRLEVLRGEDPLVFEIPREEIALSDVESRVLEGDVGYVRVFQFARGAADQLESAVLELLAGGAVGLVLDLRGNAGGLAEEAYEAAGLFLDGGVVARIRGSGGAERTVTAEGEPIPPIPVVVLIDGGTASASEILAGALQDRGRALLVGTRTFGKGSVLSVDDLEAGGASIQFTSGYFLTPNGHLVEGQGIAPDLVVPAGDSGDPQLDRAVAEVLRQLAS